MEPWHEINQWLPSCLKANFILGTTAPTYLREGFANL